MGAAVTGVSGADDIYGDGPDGRGVSGTVGIRGAGVGGVHDALGREMAADYDAGPGKEMDFTPPTVVEITPLDGSPTNAAGALAGAVQRADDGRADGVALAGFTGEG